MGVTSRGRRQHHTKSIKILNLENKIEARKDTLKKKGEGVTGEEMGFHLCSQRNRVLRSTAESWCGAPIPACPRVARVQSAQ